MNNIPLVSAGLTQALTDAPVSLPQGQASENVSGTAFTLPQMVLAELTERVRTGAHSQPMKQPAEEVDQAAQLQMLLALFLTQPVQPAPEKVMNFHSRETAGQLLQTLTQPHKMGGNLVPKEDQMAGANNMVLSPKLQAVMSSLMQSDSIGGATPAQQATLVQVAAQNLQAIAPETRTSPALARSSERHDSRLSTRISAADRPEHEKFSPASLMVHSSFVQPKANVLPEGVVTVSVNTHSEDWGEQLTHLLKDRIQFQIGQQQQTSTIRLDPPSLGKLEISIHIESGKLIVHIGASQADVCRSLQQLSDNLRQQLTEQNFVQVQVQVSPDGQSHQQDRRQGSGQQQQQIVSAIELENEENNFKQNDSVLIKV